MLFVCTSGKTCPTQGSEAVHAALKEAAFAAGLGDAVRVNKAGCFAQCGHGPMVAAWPEGRWYAAVRVADVPDLVEAELRAGRPLERLLYRPAAPGKNVCRAGEEPGTIPPFVPPPGPPRA
jgi:(2Fe-2S) ferredoxin